jgi:glyoxylate utilization-related uncharacterized protein
VPQVCREKSADNGAIPEWESCLFLVATSETGLGNFFCDSIVVVEESCGLDDDSEPSEEEQEQAANAGDIPAVGTDQYPLE